MVVDTCVFLGMENEGADRKRLAKTYRQMQLQAERDLIKKIERMLFVPLPVLEEIKVQTEEDFRIWMEEYGQ